MNFALPYKINTDPPQELADILINLRNRWYADGDATDWLHMMSEVSIFNDFQ